MFDAYWRFACERQEVYFLRLAGARAPWTSDPILRDFRFTNAYRAADRTSQFLIGDVIYRGSQDHREQVFRALLFRLFNLPSTWRALEDRVGSIEIGSFDERTYARALDEYAATGARLYSAAYVIPPVPRAGYARKHHQHLQLVRWMLEDRVDERVADAASLEHVFRVLGGYPSLGRFLAFQLAIDLNYGPHLGFSEMDFVAAGPGASEGIRKCFEASGDWTDDDIIRWVADHQEIEFVTRGLDFTTLWGRPLQLIDCQNLFCEIAKYSRVSHPEFTPPGGRHRLKRTFTPRVEVERPWFPPKWGINGRIAIEHAPRSVEQLDSAFEQV
ncbi:MAG: nucleotide kinase domain-containing protein [Pseudomonadota bacterium]